jgi:transposase
MLFVGIDVAKNKHDVAVLSSEGEIVLNHLRIQNNRDGFTELHITLHQLVKDSNEDIRIALEDTGHYSFNIIAFLRANGYQVYSYNPLLIKEFASSKSLRKTKTDKKDAMTIAKKLRDDSAPERYEVDESIQDLKYLTRHRERMIQKQSDLKVQLTRLLDITFPELASIVKKTGIHNQSTYELLKNYPSPQKIHRARLHSIIKIKGMKADKAMLIHEKSATTIGTSSYALEFEILQTIQLIEAFKPLITEIDSEIEKLMTSINSPITTIPGIANTLGSVILAEVRNIHNFKTPGQLLAFAGLEPSIYQSGQMDVNGKMVKRGSTHLRWALLQAAKLVARWSPCFNTYLAKKLAEGKHYNVAVSHVAKKLIRVIFYLLKTNSSFDEAKLI